MSLENKCSHEVTEWGSCVACGANWSDAESEPRGGRSGCQNRGWYHDGSEQEESAKQGRKPLACPNHVGVSA